MSANTQDLGIVSTTAAQGRVCLFCGNKLSHTVTDLGMHPPCESFVPADKLNDMEPFFPLHVMVCDQCFLVQIDEYIKPEEIFTEYAYFSSYSNAWLEHARKYTEMIVDRLHLDGESFVVELASNDGYLLKNFVERKIPVLGIEPAANVAKVAIEQGIDTAVRFFGKEYAKELRQEGTQADLIIGNNVLAQVPDINSFVGGMKILLAPGGTITIEFPHLMRLMAENQFDTIYHEHFFYFSLYSVEKIFAAHGLTIYDVEELWTHGGSLRIYARHTENDALPVTRNVTDLREREQKAGLNTVAAYAAFDEQVKETKRKILEFLIRVRREGKTVAGYGAPGKGNTLLNYCGIRTDFIDYTVDRNPYKHGRFLPGTHIPIFPPDKIQETKPDYVFILPWNLKDEIMGQLSYIREWGGRFVVPIPETRVYS
jgi:hypothetical protein